MSRRRMGVVALALFAVGAWVAAVQGAEEQAAPGAAQDATPPMCSACMMCAAMARGDEDAAKGETNMLRCHAAMNAATYPTSPAALLANAELLNLTEEQQQKLTQILDDARARAREVLTEQQLERLAQMPDEPTSAMENIKQMHKGMHGAGCPLMQGADADNDGEGTQSAARNAARALKRVQAPPAKKTEETQQ